MSEMVKVLVVAPGKGAVESEIENTLEGWQKVVGGYVQPVDIEGFTIFCNENGIAERLPFNRQIGPHTLYGTIFIAKSDEDGDLMSLSPAEVEQAQVLAW